MRHSLLLDQFHLSILVPPGLPVSTYRGMRRTLANPRFHAALKHTMDELTRRYPSLRHARFTWSQ
jgi:hypothetical protein